MARWLPSGVIASDCIAAYEAQGVASYAASLTNLNNPGTNDLIEGPSGDSPAWSAATGWYFDPSGNKRLFGPSVGNTGNCTVIASFAGASRPNFANDAFVFGISGNAAGYPWLAFSCLHGGAGAPGSPTDVLAANGNSTTTISGAITSGTVAVAARKVYIDGVDQGVTLGAWTGTLPTDHRLAIGALADDVSDYVYRMGGSVHWIYVYNRELTADEIGDIIANWILPTADFVGNPTSGYSPLTVAFTNLSTNATSYSWTFGDGDTSTEVNPTHVYRGTGPWTVSLTATNETGSDTETKASYIVAIATTVFTQPGAGAEYMLWLNTPTGDHLAAIPEFYSLQAVRTVNDIGALTLAIPDVVPWRALEGRRDLQIEIWRKTFGGHYSLLTDTVWYVRSIRMSRVNGALQYTLSAFPAVELLSRRIVYAPTGDADTDKTDPADDVMKAIVREAMGSLVIDSARSIESYVGIASDISAAPEVTKKFAYRNVLQVLQELAQTSTALGTPLYFDIEASSSTTLNFYTYINQRGIDRSSTTGDNSLIISELTGALVDPSWVEDYTSEVTYVYAGGEGNGAARIIGTAPSSTSTEYGRQFASVFNRREAWADARNGYSTVAACEYEAENVLRAGRPRKLFEGRLLDTAQSVYSLNWNWGDRVTAVFNGLQIDCIVSTINIEASGGRETISAQLRSVL